MQRSTTEGLSKTHDQPALSRARPECFYAPRSPGRGCCLEATRHLSVALRPRRTGEPRLEKMAELYHPAPSSQRPCQAGIQSRQRLLIWGCR